nr:MAG TPA: hypothetical protein [Crassvirales sp.]
MNLYFNILTSIKRKYVRDYYNFFVKRSLIDTIKSSKTRLSV